MLHAVAQGIRETIRRTDMVSRMGGDEFALLLPNTSREAGRKLLEKVIDLLSATMKQKGWPVTFSIGAVTFLSAPESVERMIEHADETMYSVKQTGKNRICQKEMAA